jgi:hypothetical protein
MRVLVSNDVLNEKGRKGSVLVRCLEGMLFILLTY